MKTHQAKSSWVLAIKMVLTLTVALFVSACDIESRVQAKGFSLPKGDVAQGEANFVLLQCNDCHSITGVVSHSGLGDVDVVLGGATTRVKTYGDLVTSIINPSHKLSRGESAGTVTSEGESTMRDYNEVMSVQELIDVVEFLQSKYEIWIPEYHGNSW